MKDRILYILLLVMFSTLGCNNKTESYKSVDEMIADASKSVVTINTENLKAELDGKAHLTIVDCREEKEFIKGHIPGAINVPRGMLEFSKVISDRRSKLYIYSQTNQRALLSATVLRKLKYKHVLMIDGGWDSWHEKFPELIEEGSGSADKATAEPEEDGGGCG